ncbi:hypothetical protein H257_01368 [Aphanomyces astaci]|uniref:Uncharacterized protein n=1 Tax=Aphanomyces astaci TaxID=112090 RepID=W4H7F8_APHAT|nr:hypothetical protein H257_01368 [Aphanomyces astaci]ETV87970.1 hypothetical protein H257_01368 [Aphanomyces astaci]|eukprot:XP_009822833.1 hypothetical protein H257_01368 [Aphanomyces astaci]
MAGNDDKRLGYEHAQGTCSPMSWEVLYIFRNELHRTLRNGHRTRHASRRDGRPLVVAAHAILNLVDHNVIGSFVIIVVGIVRRRGFLGILHVYVHRSTVAGTERRAFHRPAQDRKPAGTMGAGFAHQKHGRAVESSVASIHVRGGWGHLRRDDGSGHGGVQGR